MITHASFMFKANFPSLYDASGDAPVVDTAITTVYAEYAGVPSLWSTLSDDARNAKIDLCMNYLTAWWLADMNPTSVVGVQSDGGMPLTSKSIGGISLSRKELDSQPGMKHLESNAFGMKALVMLMSAPERFGLIGRQSSMGPAPRGTPQGSVGF